MNQCPETPGITSAGLGSSTHIQDPQTSALASGTKQHTQMLTGAPTGGKGSREPPELGHWRTDLTSFPGTWTPHALHALA